MKIEGSVILITGGASGIGETIAKYFMEKGGIIYICDLQESKGLKLQNDTDSKIKFIKCDITNDENVKQMIDLIAQERGRLDAVINSAGISFGELIASNKHTHNISNFERAYKINTYGSFLVSKHAAKLMCEKAEPSKECNGSIIFISSVAGIEGQRGQTAYSASKSALLGMVLPMARDLGKYKIRVNAIAPGLIETPMTETLKGSSIGKGLLQATPLGTFGKPPHIANAAEFLITNDFVNGTHIRVDGGIRFPSF